jgi:RecA/RadA recombinase
MSFLNDIIKSLDNEYACIADDGIAAGDVVGFISTGSLLFNALLGGSLFNGLPDNKITAFAGEESTGKTFLLLDAVKNFLIENLDGVAIIFETEGAISKKMLVERGIDAKRVLIIPVQTVQEFRTSIHNVLDVYIEQKKSEKKPMFLGLDSVGMLSTTKEMEDTEAGKETQDMTRARLLKGVFRTITLKLAKAGVPLVLTNHTYLEQGVMYPRQIMGGGKGAAYAASTVIFLSKSKDKDGKEVIGVKLRAKLQKGRIVKENTEVELLLNYKTGLYKYFGLLEFAQEAGIVERIGNKYKFPHIEEKVWEKEINRNPETYFTREVLEELDEYIKTKFTYGSVNSILTNNEDDDMLDDEEVNDAEE